MLGMYWRDFLAKCLPRWDPVTVLAVLNLALVAITASQAYFARENNRLTRNISISSQQAWVGVSSPPVVTATRILSDKYTTTDGVEHEDPQMHLHLDIWFKNFGESPAFRVVPYIGWAVNAEDAADKAMAGACNFADLWHDATEPSIQEVTKGRVQGRTLFPGHELRVAFAPKMATKKIPTNTSAWLLGCIAYTDIFGAKRRTRFCYHSEPLANQLTRDTRFRQCWFLNDGE